MQPDEEQPPAYQQGDTQQQTTVVQQQSEVTVQQGSNATPGAVKPRGSWCWKGLRITGYIHIVLGVLAVLFGIISIVVKTHLHPYGVPVWCGICFVTVAGIFGLAAGFKQNTGWVTGYMVMSLFSSLAACGIIGVGGGAIETDTHVCPDHADRGYIMYIDYSNNVCSTSSGLRVGIDVCIMLIGIAEIIVSVVGASFTCCGLYYTCCSTRSSNASPLTMGTYHAYPQQMVIGAPPQGVYYPPGATVASPYQVVMQPAQGYQPQGQIQPPPQGQIQPPPQGQFQPPPQGQFQPPPQGQFQPPLQGQFQPPPQGQFQPPPQGQFQPPPQGQFQPPPQGQFQPEAPLDPRKGGDHE